MIRHAIAIGLALGLVQCRASGPEPGRERAVDPAPAPATAATGSAKEHGNTAAPAASGPVKSGGNTRVDNVIHAKQHLRKLYKARRDATTLYGDCVMVGTSIDWSKCCIDPERRRRVEWEHVVPAYALGRDLPAWRRGDKRCVGKRGKRFKGRRCAHKVSRRFRLMEADMHNLFPSVGALNEARRHFPMAELAGEARSFGRCDFEVERERVEPREAARGEIARAYKYMALAYPRVPILDATSRALMDRWDAADPPEAWEHARNRAIAARQGNENPYISRHREPAAPTP